MQLSPEHQLLCNILGRGEAYDLDQVSAEGWDALIQAALQQGVAPLVYHKVKTASGAPVEVLTKLRKFYLAQAHRNTLYYHELASILRGLHTAGIPVIILKGAYLAEHVYKNIALRGMTDVDMMVHKDDLEKTQLTLTSMGYTSREYWLEAEDALTHALPPFSKPKGIMLDVHWTFENPDSPFTVDEEAIWQRTVPGKLAGEDVLCLSAEDMLLHLCLHTAYHHRFEVCMRSVCDIAELIFENKPALDWSLFLSRTKEWGAVRCVFTSLQITERLLGLELPAGVLKELQPDDYNSEKENWIVNQIFSEPNQLSLVGDNVALIANTASLWGKIKRVAGTLFPSGEMLSTKFPVSPTSFWRFRFLPRLWARLFKSHGSSVWNLMTGDESTIQTNRVKGDGYKLADWLSKADN